ncbi:hypothetical protein E2C01_044829 [Portunus trituberculatus]|uniref:Uncharacterized protein n=1 Tax=Portunus trituberculatus TaxID=210409 RepID=A0A5B7G171_PORTR|nr:hypothetical protein [Portunus trituberculatus]
MGVFVPPATPHHSPGSTHAPHVASRTLNRQVAASLAPSSGGVRRGSTCVETVKGRNGKDPTLCHGPLPPRMTLDALPVQGSLLLQFGQTLQSLGGCIKASFEQGIHRKPAGLPPALHLHTSSGTRVRDRPRTHGPEGGGSPTPPVTNGASRLPTPAPLPLPEPNSSTCVLRTLQEHLTTSPRTTDTISSTSATDLALLPRTLNPAQDLLLETLSPTEAATPISSTPSGSADTHVTSQVMGSLARRRNSKPPAGPFKPLRLRLILVVLLLTVSRAQGELLPLCLPVF